MTPEAMAGLVRRWVQLYTRGLPAPVAERRVEEVAADLREHIDHERAHGARDRRVALGLASRMVRGMPADAAWREGVLVRHPWAPHEARARARSAYRRAVAVAAAAVVVLVWMIGALGIIGDSGDGADRMYLAVLAIGVVGAAVARFRARGMARALAAMAAAQLAVGIIAVLAGLVPAYNTPFEVLALSGFFAALFLGSALLFRRAGRQRTAVRRADR